MTRRRECVRPACTNIAFRPGVLCNKHFQAHPLHGWVSTESARLHMESLHASGMSWAQIGERAGLTCVTLRAIRNTRVKCSAAVAAAIMAVTASEPDGLALVPAVGTVRRLQALQVLGWTQAALAAELGLKDFQRVSHLIYKRRFVSAWMAARVAEVFDRLQFTAGPSKLTASRARTKGWVAPLAWDDIDDPDEVPTGQEANAPGFAERYRELRHHVGVRDRDQIAELLGITRESLDRQLIRHRIAFGVAS